MAFVAECPFCKSRAKVPDRALGGLGQCPKCANSFTLAAVDDQRLPESSAVPEPVSAASVDAAIAEAVASAAANDAIAADALRDEIPRSSRSRFQPAVALGALALLLDGAALIGSSLPALHGLVLPLCALGFLTGLVAIVVAWQSRRKPLLLPILGSTAAGALLIVAWLFPGLLGPGYEFSRQRPAPVPPGLRAIPLAGAPALADPPESVDARLYALQRDGLRVEVIRVSQLPADAKAVAEPKERFAVRVRISLGRADSKPLERKDHPAPTLTDDAGQPYRLRHSEFFDRGGGKAKPGLFPVPTIEETFVFDAPAEGWKRLRLELPAERWNGTGVFPFTLTSGQGQRPVPLQKKN